MGTRWTLPVGASDGAPTGLPAAVGAALGRVSSAVARARHDRSLHPDGALLEGRLRRHGAARSGVAWLDTAGDDAVAVRLSRGGGLPHGLPDVQGLAVHHEDGDLLLSTTGSVPVLRHVLALRRRPGGTYTSLLPFRSDRGAVLLGATPVARRRLPVAPEGLPAALDAEPWRLRLVWAAPGGPWRPVGHLEVTGRPAPAARGHGPDTLDVRADPLRTVPGLSTYPLVATLRTPAYRASRTAVPSSDRTTPPVPGAPPPVPLCSSRPTATEE